MSGRILPNRPGYGNVTGYPPGYGCLGIVIIHLNCVECNGNRYLSIPISETGVISNTPWVDYQDGHVPSESVPDSYSHPCQDNFEQGFLEVEYPDVPPVSVRGISLKFSTESPKVCTVCWEYDRVATPVVGPYYLDNEGDRVFPFQAEYGSYLSPAPPMSFNGAVVDETYLEDCDPDYDPITSKSAIYTVTFIYCPITDYLFRVYDASPGSGYKVSRESGAVRIGNSTQNVSEDVTEHSITATLMYWHLKWIYNVNNPSIAIFETPTDVIDEDAEHSEVLPTASSPLGEIWLTIAKITISESIMSIQNYITDIPTILVYNSCLDGIQTEATP